MTAVLGAGPLALLAAGSFIATNLDNLSATTAQVAAAKPGRERRIARGHLLGACVVVAVAAAVAAGLHGLPVRLVGLLGLVAVALGLGRALRLRTPEGRAGRHKWPLAGGSFSAAAITMANSGENLPVYIPLFFGLSGGLSALAIAVLIVLDLALLALSLGLARRSGARSALPRVVAWAGPLFLVAVGVTVVVRAETKFF
jgi:cadmium resistance protein CadD (predicted permease)